ncbi:energy transducer TonB [Duganella sp. P38]|uniref:energy transducer TonB n=1 Tax=Duganella sp. P38 TaxID=3423949 RepID=UPI003D7A4E44
MASSGASAQEISDYTPRFARPQRGAEPIAGTCNKPEWPVASLRNEETGIVTLRFTIAPNGQLIKNEVSRSTGFPLLDKASLVGLASCRFRPASINGKPVQSVAYMQYVWRLD